MLLWACMQMTALMCMEISPARERLMDKVHDDDCQAERGGIKSRKTVREEAG